MKTKSGILIWLSSCIFFAVLFGFALQYNWRSSFDFDLISRFEPSIDPRTSDDLVRIVYLSDPPSHQEFPNHWRVTSVAGVFPASLIAPLRHMAGVCCSDSPVDCEKSLESFADISSGDFKLWILHDSSCTNSPDAVFDNIGFTSNLTPEFVKQWDSSEMSAASGPFKSDRGLAVVRFLLVDSTGRRLQYEPSTTFAAVRRFFARLSTIVEVVFDTQTVYSGEGERLLRTIQETRDPYELSRLVNEEIETWTGPPHLLEFGAYAIPPVGYIALVVGDTDEGVYSIEDWGAVNFKKLSDVFDCVEKTCIISSVGESYMNDLVISVVRQWLGLLQSNPAHMALSNSELILLANARRRRYFESMAEDIRKQQRVLNALPRLAFPREVANLMHESIDRGMESLSTSNLAEGVVKAKLAATLAGEALHHESIMAAPSFSIEYLFALYAPVGLPIIFPVLTALVAMWRKNRAREKSSEKID